MKLAWKHTHLEANLREPLPTGEWRYCVLCRRPMLRTGPPPRPYTPDEAAALVLIADLEYAVAEGTSIEDALQALSEAERETLYIVMTPWEDLPGWHLPRNGGG